MRLSGSAIILTVLALSLSGLSGCTSWHNCVKTFIGTSTQDVEDARNTALTKVFDYDYDTCYAKMEKLLKLMRKASVYAKNNEMIAFYYIDPNDTPVGIFFKKIDPAHTQVEVSSLSTPVKETIAKNLFSETTPDVTERKPLFKPAKKNRDY